MTNIILYCNKTTQRGLQCIFSHVQVNNDSAIAFYDKFGFEIVEKKENYYKRIEPADAYVLQKTFRSKNEQINGEEKTES